MPDRIELRKFAHETESLAAGLEAVAGDVLEGLANMDPEEYYQIFVHTTPRVCQAIRSGLQAVVRQRIEQGEQPPCAPEDIDALVDGAMIGMLMMRAAMAYEPPMST